MYYASRSITIAIALISAPVLAAAAWFSIQLARADTAFRRADPDSVARAIAIEPGNTEYLALHALQLDYAGNDPIPTLERAALLSPLNSAPRLRLGLAYEIRGDNAMAERWLHDAARVDHQFDPRWTLANFYFRRATAAEPDAAAASATPSSSGEAHESVQWANKFWTWMHSALDVSYGDRRPAFDLCWRMGSSDEILTRAIPDQHDVLAAYLIFLLERSVPDVQRSEPDVRRSARHADSNADAPGDDHRDAYRDAVAPVALKLASFKNPADRPLLLSACNFLIDAAQSASSITARNAFSGTAQSALSITARALDLWRAIGMPEPSGVFNGSFASPILNSGFDWRVIESPGVTHLAIDQPRPAHRISFDGREPESCALLTQIVHLEPHVRYRLKWTASTRDIAAKAAIAWTIGDLHAPITKNSPTPPALTGAATAAVTTKGGPNTAPPVMAGVDNGAGETSATGQAEFIATSTLQSLTLIYRRPSGEARAEGSIDIARVTIERVP